MTPSPETPRTSSPSSRGQKRPRTETSERKHAVFFGELLLRLATPRHERFVQAHELQVAYTGAEANAAVCAANFGVEASVVSAVPEQARQIVFRSGKALSQSGGNESEAEPVVQLASHGTVGLNVEPVVHGIPLRRFHTQNAGSIPASADEHIDKGHQAGHDFPCLRGSPEFAAIVQVATDGKPAPFGCLAGLARYCGDVGAQGRRGARPVKPLLPGEDAVPIEVSGLDFRESAAAPVVDHLGGTLRGAALQIEKAQSRAGAQDIICPDPELPEKIDACLADFVLSDGKETCMSDVYRMQMVDRVGGGDAFSGALIYALLAGIEHPRAISFAAAAACLKHTIHGDFNHVSIVEVEALMSGNDGGRIQR